jgi:hypothetical protein
MPASAASSGTGERSIPTVVAATPVDQAFLTRGGVLESAHSIGIEESLPKISSSTAAASTIPN